MHTTLPDPAAARSRGSCRRSLRWLALWLGVAMPGVAGAAPALEYGPEAEARFRQRCSDGGATDAACQALMEQLQARLGYEAFLERADRGPDAFGIVVAAAAAKRT